MKAIQFVKEYFKRGIIMHWKYTSDTRCFFILGKIHFDIQQLHVVANHVQARNKGFFFLKENYVNYSLDEYHT